MLCRRSAVSTKSFRLNACQRTALSTKYPVDENYSTKICRPSACRRKSFRPTTYLPFSIINDDMNINIRNRMSYISKVTRDI
ncbi:unnamed protein product, partial [Adineta ricciae]